MLKYNNKDDHDDNLIECAVHINMYKVDNMLHNDASLKAREGSIKNFCDSLNVCTALDSPYKNLYIFLLCVWKLYTIFASYILICIFM